IAGVIAIAVAVAFEPKLTRRSELAGAGPPRTPIGLRILWRAPSIVLSVMDWLLARVVASLVGARLRGPLLRYLWGGGIILGAMAAALFAPRPWGLWAALAGIAAVVAVVRRWSWIEADRDTFIIERGAREGAIRVGFREDLRDEALLGIVCLFALIPLLLRQVQIETCAAGSPAFSPVEGCTGPRYSWRALLAWLGYFGGELAKSVPFVDWSEVFEVVNASPIEPQTAIGKQIVFAVRAGLDLLLLATVVQAVGI
ncbi:MAG: hypothetical protein GWO02_22710, partial [Gammaproteobacteria bacterium]|nr:hypothetical protein [Gammaproteobacteria bacterium]